MRLTGGEGKGRRLADPPQGVRPTSGRLKETLFNILGQSIRNAKILDLYAGSGALGLEALARGAERAVFVEKSHKVVPVIRENISRCGFEAKAEIVHGDVLQKLRGQLAGQQSFDFIFADPPYADKVMGEVLEIVAEAGLLSDAGLVIFESSSRVEQPLSPGWCLVDKRKVGDTSLLMLGFEHLES